MPKWPKKLYQHKSSWGSIIYTIIYTIIISKKPMGGPQVWDSRANLFLTLFPALSAL